jgi:hypothetical protein
MALSDGGGDQEAVMWARIGRMECGLVSHREGYCRFLHHGDPNPYFEIGHALSCHYLLTGSILWSFFLELWAEQLIRGDIGRAYSGAMCWSARRGSIIVVALPPGYSGTFRIVSIWNIGSTGGTL